MLETILIIITFLILLGGIGDLLFGILDFGLKIILGIILIIASIWLALKLFVVMIPWMFALCVVCFFVGIIWLIKSLIKHS